MSTNPPAGRPTVVVVGAATRDLASDDPRGWRVGGGVSYSALATARLGLPTGALVGVDDAAASAEELDVLRAAGVDVRLIPLEHGPVFQNVERPEGRLQLCRDHSDLLDPSVVPDGWASAPGWILAPVAAELPEEWADVPSDEATVALGWQGLLRDLAVGGEVSHVAPRDSRIVRRADLVGISRDDIDPAFPVADLLGLLRPGATLAVTQGDRGGLVMDADTTGPRRVRHYPAVLSHDVVDPTGAGDVFLAALAAARIEPRLVGGRIDRGYDLLLAAAAASLVLEGWGTAGVPSRDAIRIRMAEASRRRGASVGEG
ncbi:MAG: PfkB family carbohydrate kinase [Chloroflexota bacterium]|jgi:sugar/nucleoside kinase (ribokinase family)